MSGMTSKMSIFFFFVGECWNEVSAMALDNDQRSRQVPPYQNQLPLNALQIRHSTITSSPKFPQIWSDDHPILSLLTGLLSGAQDVGEGRRLPFMVPVMYNLGVITTLLVLLTFLMFKGLTLGIIMLILNLKGKGLKYQPPVHPLRPVHIHVHGDYKRPPPHKYYYYPDQWDRLDEEEYSKTTLDQIFHPRSFRR